MPAADRVVYIVDDDEAVRDSLVTLLEARAYRTKAFGTAEGFLESGAAPSLTGCLLLDVNLPGVGGLSLLQQVKQICPHLPVLMITGMGQVATAVQAMKAGALDFLEKPLDPDALFALVDRAMAASARASASAEQRSKARTWLERLTPRERSVFDRLVQGKTNKQIAGELQISPRTVEIHRANLMEKLGATSVSDLIRLSSSVGAEPEAGN
jgi:FixJ family two-component response regulator